MKIVVDRMRCVGVGVCEATAPDSFEVGASGQVVVLIETISDQDIDEVETAVRSCPTGALAIES